MEQLLSVTEAARNFSEIINRVYYQRQTYLLTRGGTVVAKLTTTAKTLTGAELAERWPHHPPLDAEDAARWEEELAQARAALRLPEASTWDS